jgi:antitoxin MazE
MKAFMRSDVMKVFKRGNGLAVRLPAAIVDALGLKEGDDIDIHLADSRATFDAVQKTNRREWVKRLRRFRGMMPADFKFDRDEANAR